MHKRLYVYVYVCVRICVHMCVCVRTGRPVSRVKEKKLGWEILVTITTS